MAVATGGGYQSAVTSSASQRVRTAARDCFGWPELRPGQEEAVVSLVEGRDTLAVMPTGSGKSAIYQLAGLLLDGATVVVSPLIALQRDQVAHLAERAGAPEAVAVNSAETQRAQEEAWESMRAGDGEFLFLSPEQLANEEVVARLSGVGVSLVAVDEAHCVSAWGHDFRPDYLRLGDVLERLGHPVVCALTATAAPPVREEILTRLRMREARVVVRGFDRPNLWLEVRRFTDADSQWRAVLDRAVAEAHPGIVYTATRAEAERMAADLAARGLRAAPYHAGLRAGDRRRTHEDFLAGALDVVAATTAFGMGIDKPDVRFVLHARIPESLDAYYQEIGRAGRDGEPALAMLAYRAEDLGLRRFFTAGRADPEVLSQVAGAVRAGDETAKAVAGRTGLSRRRATNALNLLEQAGAVRAEEGAFAWTDPAAPVPAAVELAQERADAHRAMEQSRLEMMRGYAETDGCRRQFMLGYFGEQLDEACGRCDRCREAAEGIAGPGGGAGGTASDPATVRALDEAEARYPTAARVHHREWGAGTVMSHETDRVTVLFDEVGYRTLSLELLREDSLLTVDAA